MQPHIPDADVDPDEAFQLVFRELKRHEKTGRRNFVVRVPVDLLEYLFSAILRKSEMSRVALERLLTELGIYGVKDADGRISPTVFEWPHTYGLVDLSAFDAMGVIKRLDQHVGFPRFGFPVV